MKYTFTVLTITFFAFNSCTKKIDVIHDIHDTLYLEQVRVDTFHSVVTRIDTVILHDNHRDTVVQIKHDTLILTKTTTDTLFRNLFDTVYLTKTLHDTVTETVYLHDTINNFICVVKHDTVIQIVTVIQIDTVTNFIRTNWLNYPVPAPDSAKQFFVHFDTIPGLTITSIEFQNIYSWDLPAGSSGFFSQDITYHAPIFTRAASNGSAPVHDWQIYLPGPMVCNIIITYDASVLPIFQLETFPTNPGSLTFWETTAPGGLGGAPGTIHMGLTSKFEYINLPSVFEMNIRNH